MHDTHLLDGLTISYAHAWEHNRREQQGLVLGRKEDALHEAIEKIQDPDGPNEERVHTEIMNFLARDIEVSSALNCRASALEKITESLFPAIR